MVERDEALVSVRASDRRPVPVCPSLEPNYSDVLALMLENPGISLNDERNQCIAQLVTADVFTTVARRDRSGRIYTEECAIGRHTGLVKNPSGIDEKGFCKKYGVMNGIVEIDGGLYCAEVSGGSFNLIRSVRREDHDRLLGQFRSLVSQVT